MTSFYTYRQNNSGGSFAFDDKRGISVDVVIEAGSESEARNKAQAIGIYFDGCSTGQDCSCCGDRWSDYPDCDNQPKAQPGDLFPAQDDPAQPFWMHKWMEEGKPEGFIHYLDGRVEGFWAETAERKDLDGSYGWGVQYNRYGATVFLCGANGYDETGNLSAPWSVHDGDGEVPTVDQVIKTNKTHGYGNAWFRSEDDAIAFAEDYNTAMEGLKEVVKAIKSVKKDGKGKPSTRAMTAARSVFLK